jgi:phytoene synthase
VTTAARDPDEIAARAEYARDELRRITDWGNREGIAVPDLGGNLFRPIVALAGWQSLSSQTPSHEFWCGVMAIQLAHEASLVHDDVIDGASHRRGTPTVVAEKGVAAALVRGDHLLTTAYRYAARTRSISFVETFARAVERTVAGELAQARATGRILDLDEYLAIVRGKSGELIGCALSLAPSLMMPRLTCEYQEIGCRIGVAYQMLDDLLDLSPSAHTGKPPLSDYAQKHWTWPLEVIGVEHFDESLESLMNRLHAARDSAQSPAHICLSRFERAIATVSADSREVLGDNAIIASLLERWCKVARQAIESERNAIQPTVRERAAKALHERASILTDEIAYLSKNSRSFRFAARFFPRPMEDRIARVYAYCRFTDDIVDEAENAAQASEMLDEWMRLSHAAYLGQTSGIPLLDSVMSEMAAANVPFRYAEELAEGMRMDLSSERYGSMSELKVYTRRVASVVGFWVSELFGVRDPAVLSRADAMGHAMQLTNILRDVGEDLRAGRCYLPSDVMQRHGVAEADLAGGVSPGYRDLLIEMSRMAENAFEEGLEGLPHLPLQLRVPVAIAAYVYRGILEQIRANDYDNLTRRAGTSGTRKLILMGRALADVGATSLRMRLAGMPRLGTFTMNAERPHS